jgi:hypothetical protein
MNRQKLNEKRYKIGQNIEISFVQLLSLIVINLSLVSVILNLFLKGRGNMEWWSVYFSCALIFSYLILRIFTSSGLVLGRQVTLLATVFNFFLNIANFLGIVGKDATWQLTILIPAVNLACMAFLVVAFIIRKKRFRAIILPSLTITIFGILPIVRLYIRQEDAFGVPPFATAVLALYFGLFINSLVLNWLNIKQSAQNNIEQIKKGVNDFKRAGEKVSAVNSKIENFSKNAADLKAKWQAGVANIKKIFNPKKGKNQEQFTAEQTVEPPESVYEIEESDTQNKGGGNRKAQLKEILRKAFNNKRQRARFNPQDASDLAASSVDPDLSDEEE